MLTSLRLTNFKNFRDATLPLGPLNVLVGTNASGKSNLRDAFRFLHGIARGYSLAEIIGEKYGEGGALQWRGIRGGTREIAYAKEDRFALTLTARLDAAADSDITYSIEIDPGNDALPPLIVDESLFLGDRMLYVTNPDKNSTQASLPRSIYYIWRGSELYGRSTRDLRPELIQINETPLEKLTQTTTHMHIVQLKHIDGPSTSEHPFPKIDSHINEACRIAKALVELLGSMRFLDLSPDAMRQPSFPGQTVLGDRGENLSSVLQAICQDEKGKRTLLSWLRELTPMDAADFKFPADQIGRILLTLVEANGQEVSAYSASDGTLRFLAMIAALLGPEPAKFFFFEELENGIHPTRLSLLLQLIEQQTSAANIQIVSTTHSPSLLRLLSQKSREYASVIYRPEDAPDARIVRLLDLPEARRVLEEQDLARLHESGWLEDALALQNGAEAGV